MPSVTIITTTGHHRGLYNAKAGLVSYCESGIIKYAPASSIVPALLRKQAF